MSLKNLPKIDMLLESEKIREISEEIPYNRILLSIREVIETKRNELLKTKAECTKEELFFEIEKSVINILKKYDAKGLKEVINGTGILVHTNLGRSVLKSDVGQKISELSSTYTNLEYDIESGKRGKRLAYVEQLLCDITGCESAMIVNNNASSVYLILKALAKDKEVVLSRGELVEIGGSFRVSEIIREAGCIVKEVGTTNKTKLKDYKLATTENTSMYLKVHTSNFKIIGFTESVAPKELLDLRDDMQKDVIVVEDMGSGLLTDISKYGVPYERTVFDAIKDDVDIVCFSGDKLLSGSQAGIILGKKHLIDKLKEHQLHRVLRVDKLCLIALIETLKHYVKEDRMKTLPLFEMASRSQTTLEHMGKSIVKEVKNHKVTCELKECQGAFGGGSLPDEYFSSLGIFIKSDELTPNRIESFLRNQERPIVSIIQKEYVIIVLTTIFEKDLAYISKVINEI